MSTDPDEDEILDLVDANDVVVGTLTRAEANDLANFRGNNLRAANGFIINSEGKLWVPTRGPHKKIAPNGLDYSVGEHTKSGESYVDSMVRGFAEELNLTVTPEDLTYIGMTTPGPGKLPYFCANYLYASNSITDYNRDDFVSFEWLTIDEITTKLATGTPAKHNMSDSLELFSSYLSQNHRDEQGRQ